MIKGEFDSHGRPMVRATFSISPPTGSIAVAFLIDTGSVSTIIMPGDSSKLQIDFSRLPPSVPIFGIGGGIEGHPVKRTAITLVDKGALYTFYADSRIVDPRAYPLIPFPSILGQGFWKQWGLSICHQIQQVDIDPLKPEDAP
jgi:hypothetical protein